MKVTTLFITIIIDIKYFIVRCVYAEEADTDLETDRLLGQQRTDDQGFYDDKVCILILVFGDGAY